MPDWIVHIAIALVVALVFKIKNWRLIIIGALLPDLPRVLLITLNFFGFNEVNSFIILEPLHTPFVNIFESLAIALMFTNFLKNFLIIYFGVLTHHISDSLQFAGRFGDLLFYPFSYKQVSFGLFYGGETILLPILGFITIIFCFYFLKEKNNLQFNKKFYYAVIPIIITLAFMFSTPNKILENNIHGTDFLLNPEKYENREVSLYHTEVVSLNSAIEEMGHLVDIETEEKLELNSYITVTGIYKDKKIHVQEIFHNNQKKIYSSLIGMLIFFFLIFKKN